MSASVRRDTRRLPHTTYLAMAMAHRFCLVAPGDFVSTHKVSEAMALGGAGGCIPVFVLPAAYGTRIDGTTLNINRTLPFTRWLDYCEVAYFVPEANAREAMTSVLDQLATRPDRELRAKRRRLREVRDAFVFREGSSAPGARPSATEFIFAEACEAAKRMREMKEWNQRRHERAGAEGGPHQLIHPVRGADHSRCVLLGQPKNSTAALPTNRRVAQRARRRTIQLAGLVYQPTGGVVRGGYRFKYGKGY